MTDEEILKRLAEIEGASWHIGLADGTNGAFLGGLRWNPLANWSDLGPLIEKYVGGLDCQGEGPEKEWSVSVGEKMIWDAKGASLPHAICLAIIEAHK